MRLTKQITVLILFTWICPILAQQAPWPPDVSILPQTPSSTDEITLTLSDIWPRNCPPGVHPQPAVQIQGNSIYVTINDGEFFACLDISTPWEIEKKVGPLTPGCYDVYVALEGYNWNDESYTKVSTFCVTDTDAPASCWPLYLLTRDGIRSVSATGTHDLLISGHDSSNAIEIRNQILYATRGERGTDIMAYTLQGDFLKAMPTPPEAAAYLTFVSLPDERFALLDNVNDKIFIINSTGGLLATVRMRAQADNILQSIDGVVVGDRLIVSEDGHGHILQIDLTSYAVSTFKDLGHLPGSYVGAIAYANDTYYICTNQSLYSFTESGNAVKIADIPEHNTTSVVVVDESAYVTVNFSGHIYQVNLDSGTVSLLTSDLTYPIDIECASSETGDYFELCMPSPLRVNDLDSACWTFMEPWLTSLPPRPTWAPVDAVVTKIEYQVLLEREMRHSSLGIRCNDYEISIDSSPTDVHPAVMVYDKLGGVTDMGFDDDQENDQDIDLNWRQTGAFNGQSVHQDWTVCFADTARTYAGTVTKLCLRIYWEVPEEGTCCGFTPGDRVVLLVDYPRNTPGLTAGMLGTVICCDGDDPDLPIFVSWDHWTLGDDNQDSFCDGLPLPYVPNSGKWLACQHLSSSDSPSPGTDCDEWGFIPCPFPNPDVCVGGTCVPVIFDCYGCIDPGTGVTSNTGAVSIPVEIDLNFRGRLSLEVTPTSAGGGTWTGWLDPEVAGPGRVRLTLHIACENLDFTALPGGVAGQQVAEVKLFVVPASTPPDL
jgi:hypothetical protein